MALSKSNQNLTLHTLTTVLILLILSNTQLAIGCFTHIFSFGDSITDTGNYLQSISNDRDPVGNLPYGETFFGHPTGRFSDGRLIIDFFAQAYRMPFIPAYLSAKSAENLTHGVNFAVGGATALNNSFFNSKGFPATWTDYSLRVQLQWFKELSASLLLQSGHRHIMPNSLFLVGEIGGNDYNHPLFTGATIAEVKTFVPYVIQTIGSTIHELIKLGARTLLVPNNFPIGCVPAYLAIYKSENEEDYDSKTGCIKRLNEFSMYHNRMLLREIRGLRQLHPNSTIIYGDYYRSMLRIFRHPQKFGFSNPLDACCGYCSARMSGGRQGSSICTDPSKYGSWDGVHLTEAAYKLIAHGILQGPYTSPALANICSVIERNSDDMMYSAA